MKPVRILRSSGVNSSSRSGCSLSMDALQRNSSRLLLLDGGVFFALEVFLHALQAALDLFEVGEHQLQIERLRVAQRIDAARRMRHGGIVEDAQHVGQRVHFAQRRQRGIARSLFFRGAGDAAHVHVFHRGVGDLFRLIKRGQLIDARLRHARHAHVRGASRRFFVQMSPRQNAEESCFADLRQPHDSRLHKPQIVAQPARPSGVALHFGRAWAAWPFPKR